MAIPCNEGDVRRPDSEKVHDYPPWPTPEILPNDWEYRYRECGRCGQPQEQRKPQHKDWPPDQPGTFLS